jgi:hypothetical protein
MSPQAIHDDLMATLGNEAVVYRRVTKYLRTAQFDLTQIPSNSDACSPRITSKTPTGQGYLDTP